MGDYILECSISFVVEYGTIEENAYIIASAIQNSGYAIDLDDYEPVGDNEYVLLVSIPITVWDDEDPEDSADSVIRDIINNTGVSIVLDNLVYQKENHES